VPLNFGKHAMIAKTIVVNFNDLDNLKIT